MLAFKSNSIFPKYVHLVPVGKNEKPIVSNILHIMVSNTVLAHLFSLN